LFSKPGAEENKESDEEGDPEDKNEAPMYATESSKIEFKTGVEI